MLSLIKIVLDKGFWRSGKSTVNLIALKPGRVCRFPLHG